MEGRPCYFLLVTCYWFSADAALDGPLDNLRILSGISAQKLPLGHHPDAAQVKAVCIPASLDRDIGLSVAEIVLSAGLVKELELRIVQERMSGS